MLPVNLTKRWMASLLLLFAACGPVLAEPLREQADVFTSGTDGYHTFRIPAIETAPDGSLIALAEARKYNRADPGYGKQDIDLVCKRSTDAGRTWSAMTVIEDPGELWSAANPATVVDRQTGRVWLLYLRSKPGRSTETARPRTDDMQTFARTSDDNGQTWSDPIDLTAVARDLDAPGDWRASVIGPGGAIQDRRGRLIAPAWRAAPYTAFAIYSNDHGQTWRRGQILPDQEGSESQLVELSDGRILMDLRQSGGPHQWITTSRDGGQTWSKPIPGQTLPPVACAVERYSSKLAADGRDRILWTGPKGPGRTRLVVRISYDDAQTFPAERQISDHHAAYSDLTVLKDGSVGIFWERGVEDGYQFLTFTRLNLDYLESDVPKGPK